MVGAAGLANGATDGRWWVRLARSPRAIAGAFVVVAFADVIETLLFRTSLTRLIETDGAARINTLTRTTLVFTWLKVLGILTALGLLAVQVL